MIAPFGNIPLAAAQRSFLGTPFLPNQAAFLNSASRSVHHRLMQQPQRDNGCNDNIQAELDDKALWRNFNKIGTEMVITKNGR